jgi:hypothetical protein
MNQIIYSDLIICKYEEKQGSIILKGPLGSVSVYIGNLYGGHTKHSITILPGKNYKYLQSRLEQLKDGLTIGFKKRLFQAGV